MCRMDFSRRNGISRKETSLEAINVDDEIGPALLLAVAIKPEEKWVERILQKQQKGH